MRSMIAVSLLLTLIGVATPARAATVTIVCGVVPQSVELCREGSAAWAKARGHEVRVLAYPDSSTRARELIGDLLEVQAEDLDVLELDIVWPGVLAPHLLDLGSAQDLGAAGFFPAALASFEQALRMAPEDLDYMVGCGVALSLLARHAAAVEMFDRVEARDPEYFKRYESLAEHVARSRAAHR